MKSCTLDDKEISHGSEVCMDDKCMICSDGRWEDMVELYPPRRTGPKDVTQGTHHSCPS